MFILWLLCLAVNIVNQPMPLDNNNVVILCLVTTMLLSSDNDRLKCCKWSPCIQNYLWTGSHCIVFIALGYFNVMESLGEMKFLFGLWVMIFSPDFGQFKGHNPLKFNDMAYWMAVALDLDHLLSLALQNHGKTRSWNDTSEEVLGWICWRSRVTGRGRPLSW